MSESSNKKVRRLVNRLLDKKDKEIQEFAEKVRTDFSEEIKNYRFRARFVIAMSILKGNKRKQK
ncbi:hypothetical protein KAR91_02430 [Candidatus Pacearchaeota archaeon]|nr:hypothetical protein [Candidatus Pacearchaeota archaeon]